VQRIQVMSGRVELHPAHPGCKCLARFEKGALQADDGWVPHSARSGGLACGRTAFGPSSRGSCVPGPCSFRLSAPRHRPSKILAWQAVAAVFIRRRVGTWTPWSDAFGAGGSGLYLGPIAWRSAEVGRGPPGNRLSLASGRGPFDTGRIAACLAAAPNLGFAALQNRLAVRTAGCRAVAVLGGFRNPSSTIAAADLASIWPGITTATDRHGASSQDSRNPTTLDYRRSDCLRTTLV